MFFIDFKKKIRLFMGVGITGLMMVACGTDGASDVGTVPQPSAGELVSIDVNNADQVLASSAGSIGQVKSMLSRIADNFPGLSVTSSNIAQAPSQTNIDGATTMSLDKMAITLASRECSEGGSIEANSVTTSGGSVTFNQCQERGVILNGSAEVSIDGSNYSARFTNLSAIFAEGSLQLSDAGVTVVGNNFDFAIETGTANIQGATVDFRNFALNKQGSGIVVSGSIKTDCLGAWINMATTVALTFSSSDYVVSGAASIAGANNTNMQLSVNPDGSIDATLNGQHYATYASAFDLPYYGAVCQ